MNVFGESKGFGEHNVIKNGNDGRWSLNGLAVKT